MIFGEISKNLKRRKVKLEWSKRKLKREFMLRLQPVQSPMLLKKSHPNET